MIFAWSLSRSRVPAATGPSLVAAGTSARSTTASPLVRGRSSFQAVSNETPHSRGLSLNSSAVTLAWGAAALPGDFAPPPRDSS